MKTLTLVLFLLGSIIAIGQTETNSIKKDIQGSDVVIEKSKYDDRVTSQRSMNSTYYYYIDTMFIPDGSGVSYTADITVDQFELGQTITDIEQLMGVCANMEHSFLGDLQISLVCPNGQIVVLKSFTDPEGGTGYGGGAFLGIPIGDDTEPTPGIGFDYCWNHNPTFGAMGDMAASFATLPTGSYALSGSFTNLIGCPLNGNWSIKVTDNWSMDDGYMFGWSLGFDLDLVNLTRIEGNVFADIDEDCNSNGSDFPMEDVWLEFNPGPYYAITDENGDYSVYLDVGTYTVNQTNLNSHFEQNCPVTGTYTIDVLQVGDTLSGYDFANTATVYCPDLTVDIATWGIRPCMESQYTVQYSNNGTLPATDAVIDIELDPHMTYVSSTGTLLSQIDNILSFDIGTVNTSETGAFSVFVDIECDTELLGSTMCVVANISPDSSCFVPDPAWDHSSVAVEGACMDTSVCFVITNTGDPVDGDMQTESEYRIYEDNILVYIGPFQIAGGSYINVCWPANGSTIRLEADQHPLHPGYSHPQASIELCGDGESTTGIINSIAQDDLDEFVEIECTLVTGSYDPNDKRVIPTGVTDAYHYIDSLDVLEYFIRFQNTGTDTAFNVFILDTISEHLDITTLIPGVSSHPYTIEVLSSNVIRFVFSDILLPDSNINEVGSHGFVKFKVNQTEGNLVGTYIENAVGIIFDFNIPVFTNMVFNTVGYLDEITSVKRITYNSSDVLIYPNPTTGQIQVVGEDIEQIEIYNLSGVLIQSTNNREVDLSQEAKGIYFIKVTTVNGVATQKLILE